MQQPPLWQSAPPSAPPRRSNVVLIVVLALLGCVAVCCLGGGFFLWRLGAGDVYSCYDLTSKGNYHEAIPPCRALVAKTPESGAAHNQLGWDLALDGQLPEALTECRKAVDMEPNYTHYDSLAMALALFGQGEEAMKIEQDQILVNGEPRNDAERLSPEE